MSKITEKQRLAILTIHPEATKLVGNMYFNHIAEIYGQQVCVTDDFYLGDMFTMEPGEVIDLTKPIRETRTMGIYSPMTVEECKAIAKNTVVINHKNEVREKSTWLQWIAKTWEFAKYWDSESKSWKNFTKYETAEVPVDLLYGLEINNG